MATFSLNSLRNELFPNLSDRQIAASLARQHGYQVIIRYKHIGSDEYDHFGCCMYAEQAAGYLNNPNCKDAEIYYDIGLMALDNELVDASVKGDLSKVKELLDRGAYVDAIQSYRFSINTPLIEACLREHYEIVKLLLYYGADISKKNKNGLSPLEAAASKGHSRIVQLLLDKGANLDLDKAQALIAASWNGHLDAVRTLIDNGVDVNSENADGITPLYRATTSSKHNIVKLLLDKGANVNAKTRDGFSALDVAEDDEISRLLLEKGARHGKEAK